MSAIKFPAPREINRRKFFVRDEAEAYKRALAGLPPLPKADVIELVPAKTFAAELGISRRSLGRRFSGRKIGEEACRPCGA